MKVHSLSAKERIKRKKDFEMVFSRGKTIFSKTRKLKAIFFQTGPSDSPVIIAVGASKKAGNSVWRHRVKRLIKEAYRLNKSEITKLLTDENKTLLIFFSANRLNQKSNKKMKLVEIEPEVMSLINRISEEI